MVKVFGRLCLNLEILPLTETKLVSATIDIVADILAI